MISTRGRYALRVLVDLAENQGDGYITLKEVAERQEISEKYLEIIVKELVRAGILEGLRGKGGGYRLCHPAGQIKVMDVLCTLEGDLAPVACLADGSKPCPRAADCRTLLPFSFTDAYRTNDRLLIHGFLLLDKAHQKQYIHINPVCQ